MLAGYETTCVGKKTNCAFWGPYSAVDFASECPLACWLLLASFDRNVPVHKGNGEHPLYRLYVQRSAQKLPSRMGNPMPSIMIESFS